MLCKVDLPNFQEAGLASDELEGISERCGPGYDDEKWGGAVEAMLGKYG